MVQWRRFVDDDTAVSGNLLGCIMINKRLLGFRWQSTTEASQRFTCRFRGCGGADFGTDWLVWTLFVAIPFSPDTGPCFHLSVDFCTRHHSRGHKGRSPRRSFVSAFLLRRLRFFLFIVCANGAYRSLSLCLAGGKDTKRSSIPFAGTPVHDKRTVKDSSRL